MNKLTIAAIAGFALLSAGSTGAQSQLRIDCGETDVILTEEQVVMVRENVEMTAEQVAVRVCEVFGEVDASAYTEPTDVKVILPSGVEVNAQMQTSQN